MFTGIVEALGTVQTAVEEPPGRRLVIEEAAIAARLRVGESVAVNGCCLTVVEVGPATFAFQAGPETLARTNLGLLRAGDRVNLERPLRTTDRLGGHFVQGHIDGVGQVAEIVDQAVGSQGSEVGLASATPGRQSNAGGDPPPPTPAPLMSSAWRLIWVTVPPNLAAGLVPKGSVAVDGVSLTVVEVAHDRFSVALIPHTLAVTTLGLRRPGDAVNIETDILGKYVRRFLEYTGLPS